MRVNKLKSVVLAATTIAVAMSVGFAAPASASGAYLTSSAPTISRGETITYSTNQPPNALIALLINGEVVSASDAITFASAFPWEAFSPCVTIDVTFRVYADTYDGTEIVVLASDPFLAEATVEWIGDNTVDCNDAWGAGDSGAGDSGDSSEPLATTGSDASTVAGLTGAAGVVALAAAVAVARRSRRAQR
jgi:hypothetical protein